MKFIISLCFCTIAFSSVLPLAIARGGDRSSLSSGVRTDTYGGAGSTRFLLEDKGSHRSVDIAKGYMTNSDLEKAVNDFERRCINISRVYSIGKSVNGVPLWVMEISDHPGEREAKPAFKFIGNVHGDEPVGRELLVLLANWICDNYLKDPLARFIVENVHLHILPSMNPDGFSLKRRGNANNIDLNRDFPDQFFDRNDDEYGRQPETQAIMKWLREIRFTASASLHGGALVANYPWDGTDDKRYPVYGGMQDWNYIHGGCFELTLEISDDKWPHANELPTIWEYNKISMLNLVASVAKTGVHGRIFSSDSGRPLPGTIMVKEINYTVQAGRDFADYHRLLASGQKYEVMAAVPGYKSKTTTIWLGDGAATLDFILDPHVITEGTTSIHACDCDSGHQNKLLLVIWGVHLEVYVVVFVVVAFIFVLVKRRTKFNLSKHRPLSKRSVSV